jgi:hypothetical protein
MAAWFSSTIMMHLSFSWRILGKLVPVHNIENAEKQDFGSLQLDVMWFMA